MLQARTPRPCRLVMQGQLAVCVTPQKDDPGWGVGISGTTTTASNVCDKTNPIWFFLSRPRGLKTLIRTQLRLVCPDVNETTAPQVETHQQGQWGIPKCHGLHWYAVHQLRRAQDRLQAAVVKHMVTLTHPHLVPAFPPWDIRRPCMAKGLVTL